VIRSVRADGRLETGGVFVPILRKRVLDRIAGAAMQRVVLLLAPAGYGKSVALRQYLDAIKDPFVRYDVQPDNTALLGFVRGFADAVSAIAPDARRTLAAAYEANAASSTSGSDLAMWMHSHLQTYRGVIAIDDLHLAQDDQAVQQFLGSIVERTKGRVQWIIASRSYLGLPIGTWLAYGECDLAIDEQDLQFSVDEAKEAARAFRLGVRDDELHELLELTEGWPTAISFALRSSTRSVDLRSVSTMTREMIYHFLAEQVYQGFTDDERAFMECAALLPQIELSVMVAAGFDNAASLLEEIRARTAFIQEEAPGSGRYRLHDLFRDFVVRQLAMRGDEAQRGARVRVAQTLLSLARVAPALRLFAEAGDYETLIAALREHGLSLTVHGHGDEVEDAVRAVRSRAPNDPYVDGLLGLTSTMKGEYAEGDRLIARALRGNADPALRTELTLRRAIVRSNQTGDPDPHLLEFIDDPSIGEQARVEAKAILASSYARNNRTEEARRMIADVQEFLPSVTDPEVVAKLTGRLGRAYLFLNDSVAAQPLLETSAELSSKLGLWSNVQRSYATLATVSLVERNDSAMALRYAQLAAAAAAKAGDYYDLQHSLLVMLSIEVRRGNPERCAEIERQLAGLRSNDALPGPFVASSQAHRHAWNENFAEAHRLFGSILNRQFHLSDRVLVRSLHALCLALDGKSHESATATTATVEALRAARREQTLVGTLTFEVAQLFAACGEIVNERYTMAERILYKRAPFSQEGIAKRMRALVEEILRWARDPAYAEIDVQDDLSAVRDFGLGGHGRYFRLVIDAVESRRQKAARTTEVILTASEQRILRDLAAGMKPKDIAQDLGRSIHTVRTHIQNLVEKLECHGTAEAIAAARRMGLLEEPGEQRSQV
jgi:DNA-binding CsgD family transcriptional regulator/tetratricopeptide (TPR) repeat protein